MGESVSQEGTKPSFEEGFWKRVQKAGIEQNIVD